MQVREIMTANPACATRDTSLREIAQMMVEHDCGCVPIVENMASKKPIGTITDRDITIRAFATGQNPAELKASDAMTMGVSTITPDADIEECADVMEDKKIRRVVVVNDDGKIVGMVAQADIAEHGSHPSLVGNVVNEISDAPASPNRGIINRIRGNQSYSANRTTPMPNRSRAFRGGNYDSQTYRSNRSGVKEESSFGIGSLLPLLAGIGISVAAKYYLGSSKQKRSYKLEPRPEKDISTDLPHSTDKSVSIDSARSLDSIRSTDSTRSDDMTRSASASGGASSSLDSSSSTGTSGSGRSDFGNQTGGGSADLSTFGSGDFKSAGGDDLKPILEVGRNPGKI